MTRGKTIALIAHDVSDARMESVPLQGFQLNEVVHDDEQSLAFTGTHQSNIETTASSHHTTAHSRRTIMNHGDLEFRSHSPMSEPKLLRIYVVSRKLSMPRSTYNATYQHLPSDCLLCLCSKQWRPSQTIRIFPSKAHSFPDHVSSSKYSAFLIP